MNNSPDLQRQYATPNQIKPLIDRWEFISQKTGMAGMPPEMSQHFIHRVGGVPRAELMRIYIDERESIEGLFAERPVDLTELDVYAGELKQLQRVARTGRQPFVAYLSDVNENDEKFSKAAKKAQMKPDPVLSFA